LRDLGVDGTIMSKWILRVWGCGLHSFGTDRV